MQTLFRVIHFISSQYKQYNNTKNSLILLTKEEQEYNKDTFYTFVH